MLSMEAVVYASPRVPSSTLPAVLRPAAGAMRLEFSAAPSRETLALSGQASRRCGRSAWAGRHQVSPSTIDCTYAVMRRQVSFLQAGPLYSCGEPLMKKIGLQENVSTAPRG